MNHAVQVIRDLLAPDKYVIVVEHDLSVLDYLSDFICCLYGKPGAYGVVTLPFSVREGINIFLAGFVPTENLRFREESLTFKVAENAGEGDDDVKKFARYTYPVMSKTQVRVVHVPLAWPEPFCSGEQVPGEGCGMAFISSPLLLMSNYFLSLASLPGL